MTSLNKKLARDLWRLKGQVSTIALVLACGIMAMVMLRSTWHSLVAARDDYYASQRFADVFARLERAPLTLAARLERLPGVALAEPRIVEEVMLPLDEEPDPVTGLIVSLPNDREPALNGLHLRAGRMPSPGADDEAVVLAQFAQAHALEPGAVLPVVIEGRLERLRIVGVALSPEYVLALARGGQVDERRFAVLWMLESAVAPAVRMEGAFNDVSFRLEPGASVDAALAEIDRELSPYGGVRAVPRARQTSNDALTNELGVLRTMALMIPAVFLAVAAFLVNVVVSRLVFLERTQIAILKALGFTNRRIGLQYLALVALIVGVGAVLGLASGVWLAGWMTDFYTEFYRFPSSLLDVTPGAVLLAVGIGLVAAVSGALQSVRRVVRLPPAEAMRPPAPLAYRRSVLEVVGLSRFVGPSTMMVVREIERRPLRMMMSTLGIAMGVSIFVMGRFSWDSFDHLMAEVFPREHQEDLTVTFSTSKPERAVHELAALPGVLTADGERAVPVRMRAGPRWRDTAIFALPEEPFLRHLLDHGRDPIEPPVEGLLMTDALAEILDVRVGESIEIDILEGDWSTETAIVGGLIDEAFGLQAYARADWLSALLGQEPRVTSVRLRTDPDRLDDVRARLKDIPAVVAVSSTQRAIDLYRAQTGGSILVITLTLTLSAAAISIGVVYNNARIALSMRSRELASMRVLGFTRREISLILLAELAVQVVVGIPLGLWIGNLWAALVIRSFDAETIRFQLHIADLTYATAATIALLAGLVSALLVRRQLDRLDLVGVLKTSGE